MSDPVSAPLVPVYLLGMVTGILGSAVIVCLVDDEEETEEG